MPKSHDQVLTVEEAPPEATPQPAPLLDFPEPIGPADLTAVVEDIAPGMTEAEYSDLYRVAHNDNAKFDFMKAVYAARNIKEAPAALPPVAPRILEQTRAEMAAGAAAVAANAAQQGARRPTPPTPADGTTASVFRPEDFDEYKNTFKSPVQTTSKDAGGKRAMG
jgi:hypothetical protein